MNIIESFIREIRFLSRNRSIMIALMCAFTLSTVSVIGGILEYKRQQTTIENLKTADHHERKAVLAEQNSWGGAAYYGFHLTYDQPDAFAFAAMGQRDSHPWKHRIRMLALEGQIYERDANNPIVALIGRFDFSFFAAFVLPFFIIILIHDIRAAEHRDGRYHLLVATAGSANNLWVVRTLLISFALYICTVLPMVVGSLFNHVNAEIIVKAVIYLAAYMAFWTSISYWFASWNKSVTVILASLIALWVMLAVIIPTGSRLVIDKWVPVPSGAEILMTQREAVNDAWDIPKEQTMKVFLKHYPQWAKNAAINRPFEWKWYYAFQEVGDLTTEKLSNSFNSGRIKRDRLAGFLAIIAPPALLERSLQRLAKTDVKSHLDYEQKVRAFHATLREYYYPKLFEDQTFDKTELNELPQFMRN